MECYRHPGRQTGVSCSNCGRPICPDCMTPTPVGMRCPECARQKTRTRTLRSTTTEPTLTYVLIGINVLVGLGLLLGGSSGGDFGEGALYENGALIGSLPPPFSDLDVGVAHGEYWRLVTSGFVHGRGGGDSLIVIHLGFNMYLLYILGTMLEPAIGRLRFGAIYFLSLLAGSFGALLLDPNTFTAGASGAVFGLMAAAVVVMYGRGINPMESGLGVLIGINLLLTFTISGISIGGHLGGLAGGALAALVLVSLPERVRLPSGVPFALTLLLGGVVVAGSIAVA